MTRTAASIVETGISSFMLAKGGITMGSALPAAILFIAVSVTCTGCSPRTPLAPSGTATEGFVDLGVLQAFVINFRVDHPQRFLGDWVTMVDWADRNNDVDTAMLRGRCSVDQVLTETPGCNEAAAIAIDSSRTKPSYLRPSIQAGDYTLVIFNFGPVSERRVFYHIEGAFGASSATAVPRTLLALFRQGEKRNFQLDGRRTDTFAFTLRAANSSVIVGPVHAGNGLLEVAYDFSGDFRVIACVGSPTACKPMGDRPKTVGWFDIPSDFPAGPIQATVYFNPNVPQPSEIANGTVSITYKPL